MPQRSSEGSESSPIIPVPKNILQIKTMTGKAVMTPPSPCTLNIHVKETETETWELKRILFISEWSMWVDFLFYDVFMCMYECLNESIHTTCVCRYPRGPKVGLDHKEMEPQTCELPDVRLGDQTCVLCKYGQCSANMASALDC